MQGPSDSEDMAEPPPASNLPFGTPVSLGAKPLPIAPAEQKQGGDSSRPLPSQEELLARLKAKKEKLLKLAEKKRKEASARDGGSNSPVLEASSSNETSFAERNAIRFAGNTNQSTRALMPRDLTEEATNYSALRVESRGDRENLESAVSLVGTCPHMCPDEELLRRERESDIQLLETPLPGKLHPPNWTLRDTVVKRFRRSAADYKLDVPEWVRPPDVLEHVCGYLEEWVMVRL